MPTKLRGNEGANVTYAEANAAMVVVAGEILAGRGDVVEGSRLIAALRWRAENPSSEAFHVFVGVASETDHLSHPDERSNWDATAFAEKERERADVADFYRDAVLQACEDLIARLSAAS